MECKHKFTMCRLCLCESESLIDIFQVNEWFGYVAAVVITDLLQLHVSETDCYPHVVCSICLEKLTDFKQFKQQCQNSRDTYYNVFMSHDGEDEYPADTEPSTSIKAEPVDGAIYFYATTEMDINPVQPEEDEIITDDIPPQVTSTLDDQESFMVKQENDSETEEQSDRESGELSPIEIEERGSKKEYSRCNDCGEEYGEKDSLIRQLKVNCCGVNEESNSEEGDLQINTNDSSGSKSNANEVRKIGLKRKKSDKVKKDEGIKKYVCDTCGQGFIWLSDLKRHLKIHAGEKPFACDICDKRFNKNFNLKIHKLSHSGEKPFPCDICEKRFTNKRILYDHKLTHSSEKPFPCNICEKRFKNKPNLRMHILTHSSEKHFPCDICEKRFKNKSDLRKHTLTHSSEKPFPCDICGKSFRIMYKLKKHKLIHLNEKPFLCDICEKSFTMMYELKKHKLIHSSEKLFACDVCEKRFNTKSNLKKHKLIHSSEKTFACDICDKRFRIKYKLRNHKLTHSC